MVSSVLPLRERQAIRRVPPQTGGRERCRRKFLRYFPGGFSDEKYVAWEREYKWDTYRRWQQVLERRKFADMIRSRDFQEVAKRAVSVEQQSRHSMIFSFEKMALRDAVKPADGARAFAQGLFEFLHGHENLKVRFEQWINVVSALPRRQARVLTWPLVTVFGFIAQPRAHIFLKPTVTRAAADKYGFDFDYVTPPSWRTYTSLLEFASQLRVDLADLRPRDMIDIQSFIWVQGSDEYP